MFVFSKSEQIMNIKAYFKEAQVYFSQTAEHIVLSTEKGNSFDHKVFVIIENEVNGEVLFSLQINCEFYCKFFRGIAVWNRFVVIGFDTQCYLFNMETKKVIKHKLNSYFDSFFIDTTNVFICSASHVNCFNTNGEFLWQSDKLGVDSVKIYRIEEGIIYGTGDWGDDIRWRDFELNSFEIKKPKKTKKRLLSLFNS